MTRSHPGERGLIWPAPGLTTALSVAGEETWLAAETSSGVVSVCWDLRSKLQVRDSLK